MARMEASDELDGVYGTKAILAQFMSCLKPKTQVAVRQAKPADIWEAMNAVQEIVLITAPELLSYEPRRHDVSNYSLAGYQRHFSTGTLQHSAY
eukprot:2912280-Rhodomonas_salina.1